VQYLVDQGADVNARDRYGRTALYLAAENGQLSIVQYLVDQGTDVNAIDALGTTPLH
jgi:ankyrin repeat protein